MGFNLSGCAFLLFYKGQFHNGLGTVALKADGGAWPEMSMKEQPGMQRASKLNYREL